MIELIDSIVDNKGKNIKKRKVTQINPLEITITKVL